MTAQSKFITINSLSLFDACSTLFLIQVGASSEGNPLMAGLIQAGPVQFLAVKMLLTFGGTLIALRCYGRLRNARRVMNLALMAYLLLTGWHSLLLWSLAW